MSLIPDLDADKYHAHPALSATGAKRILKAPALYRWHADNPQESTQAFDIGKAAHRLVLGAGEPFEVLDYPDWRSKAAQAARDEARAAGRTPLLVADYGQVEAMAAAIRRHKLAAALLSDGNPEQSLFWTDTDTGVDCKARADWLPNQRGGRLIVPDLKTARSADPSQFRRAAAEYGYHIQAAWYSEGIRAIGYAEDVDFVFVVVEKAPPHLVSVIALDPEAVLLGARQCERARAIYAECEATGNWPGYGEDMHTVDLPAYAYEAEPFEEIVV